MANELIKKEVQTEMGTATVIIYEEAKTAIEKGWESLYFADNSDTFASVVIGNQMVVLETHGDVRLTAIADQGLAYRNDDATEIRQLLAEDKLDEYEVDANNWFAVAVGNIVGEEEDVIKVEILEDAVFEACPGTIEELETTLMEYATNLFDRVKE